MAALTEQQKAAAIAGLREKYSETRDQLDALGNSNEIWQAKARLKESMMWAIEFLKGYPLT
jgi:hypothetical protein